VSLTTKNVRSAVLLRGRKNMRQTLLVLLILALPVQAACDYFSGNDLYPLLQKAVELHIQDPGKRDFKLTHSGSIGMGYVAAIQDAFNYRGPFCVPPEVKLSQAVEIAHNYFKAHPENRHLAAWSLVTESLEEAYPCTKQRPVK
jgi:hypothetical protein